LQVARGGSTSEGDYRSSSHATRIVWGGRGSWLEGRREMSG